MRITLIVNSLAGGGAERAVVLLAEGFLKRGYKVSVITIYTKEEDFYELSVGIERICIGIVGYSSSIFQALLNNIRRLSALRKSIKKLDPDLILTFTEKINISTLIALLGTQYPIIINEQNNPQLNYVGRLWNQLRWLVYPLAKKLVTPSQGVSDCFPWIPARKKAVIYNPLVPIITTQEPIQLSFNFNQSKNWIVAMGRLTYQKNFEMLLSAFAKIADRHPQWQLLIIGEGELRKKLENLRGELNLQDRVLLPGALKNPFPVLKQAKFFVLSSHYEGFGNVLIEALACGLPVISTNCPSGPSEIVRDEIDGILIDNENIHALTEAMDSLISDEIKRQNLAARAREGASRFTLEKVIDMWEKLFIQIEWE
jgi:glycosyltransferase involved in cell wall biosynthesis